MVTVRIAIVGGDARAERRRWPPGYEVTCYQSQKEGGNGQLRSLQAAIARGKYAAVFLLTRWQGHGMFDMAREEAKGTGCKVIPWSGGLNLLAKNLDQEVRRSRGDNR